MTIKYFDDRIKYIADAGKKVKFVHEKQVYSEIVVKINNKREVEEVIPEPEEE